MSKLVADCVSSALLELDARRLLVVQELEFLHD